AWRALRIDAAGCAPGAGYRTVAARAGTGSACTVGHGSRLMARVYQVPRHTFPWLSAAVLLASLPHLLRVGSWLWVAVPGLWLWRWLIQRGRLRMPGRTL